jgi:hypothetical protein
LGWELKALKVQTITDSVRDLTVPERP